MNLLTKVISAEVKESFRIVKVLGLGKDDVRTADVSAPYGIDSNPVADMIAIYSDTYVSGEPVIIGYINQDQVAAPGELRLYSTDDNAEEKNYIWLKNSGTIEIGGDADNMVRYSELEKAFNQLKADHDKLAEKWDAFVAAYIPGSPSTTGSPATLAGSSVGASSADITTAKINEIKTS